MASSPASVIARVRVRSSSSRHTGFSDPAGCSASRPRLTKFLRIDLVAPLSQASHCGSGRATPSARSAAADRIARCGSVSLGLVTSFAVRRRAFAGRSIHRIDRLFGSARRSHRPEPRDSARRSRVTGGRPTHQLVQDKECLLCRGSPALSAPAFWSSPASICIKFMTNAAASETTAMPHPTTFGRAYHRKLAMNSVPALTP